MYVINIVLITIYVYIFITLRGGFMMINYLFCVEIIFEER